MLEAIRLFDRMTLEKAEKDSDEELEEVERRTGDITFGERGQREQERDKDRDGEEEYSSRHRQSTELDRMQLKQKKEVARAMERRAVHPDLADLDWEDGGSLPQPIAPGNSRLTSHQTSFDPGLSDYSDYDSSDEETHRSKFSPKSHNSTTLKHAAHPISSSKPYDKYVNQSETSFSNARDGLLGEEDDPFADPDDGVMGGVGVVGVGTPGVRPRRLEWGEV